MLHTFVVGAVPETVSLAAAVAWGVRLEEGCSLQEAASSLKHCLGDLYSAFGGSALAQQK